MDCYSVPSKRMTSCTGKETLWPITAKASTVSRMFTTRYCEHLPEVTLKPKCDEISEMNIDEITTTKQILDRVWESMTYTNGVKCCLSSRQAGLGTSRLRIMHARIIPLTVYCRCINTQPEKEINECAEAAKPREEYQTLLTPQ